ncbi:translation initiation factor IF-2-like [Indicator indicator]|uniref:translation initiation factor IF-2-like n=1 Tax=Indicator indicator TaxID=1002788 RepID=UPI0023DF7D83|nr:translation initiation factor IF-2-like [Indicator indicator]
MWTSPATEPGDIGENLEQPLTPAAAGTPGTGLPYPGLPNPPAGTQLSHPKPQSRETGGEPAPRNTDPGGTSDSKAPATRGAPRSRRSPPPFSPPAPGALRLQRGRVPVPPTRRSPRRGGLQVPRQVPPSHSRGGFPEVPARAGKGLPGGGVRGGGSSIILFLFLAPLFLPTSSRGRGGGATKRRSPVRDRTCGGGSAPAGDERGGERGLAERAPPQPGRRAAPPHLQGLAAGLAPPQCVYLPPHTMYPSVCPFNPPVLMYPPERCDVTPRGWRHACRGPPHDVTGGGGGGLSRGRGSFRRQDVAGPARMLQPAPGQGGGTDMGLPPRRPPRVVGTVAHAGGRDTPHPQRRLVWGWSAVAVTQTATTRGDTKAEQRWPTRWLTPPLHP